VFQVATGQRTRLAGARGKDRRTTLRVPAALEAELSRTAGDLGVSENEALVHLAHLGAEAAERRRARQRVIAKRSKAVSGESSFPAGVYPSPRKAREAILSDRS
jgi:hypothetical protein